MGNQRMGLRGSVSPSPSKLVVEKDQTDEREEKREMVCLALSWKQSWLLSWRQSRVQTTIFRSIYRQGPHNLGQSTFIFDFRFSIVLYIDCSLS